MGLATNEVSMYYRHFLTCANYTLQINITGLYNKGFPKLLVGLSDRPIYPNSANALTYNWHASVAADKREATLTLTPQSRSELSLGCLGAGYGMMGGNQLCGVYMGVECGPSEE